MMQVHITLKFLGIVARRYLHLSQFWLMPLPRRHFLIWIVMETAWEVILNQYLHVLHRLDL